MQATTYIKIRAIDSIFTPRRCEWKNCSLLLHSLNVIQRVRRQVVTFLNA